MQFSGKAISWQGRIQDSPWEGMRIYDFAKQKSILGPFCAVLFGNIGEYGNEINGLKQDFSTDFGVDFSPL